MPGLTKERLGELAVLFILKEKEEKGVIFNPSTVKRNIHNEARSLGVDIVEMARCAKIVYQHIFDKTMEELDSIIERNGQG